MLKNLMNKRGLLTAILLLFSLGIAFHASCYDEKSPPSNLLQEDLEFSKHLKRTVEREHIKQRSSCGRLCEIRKLILRTRNSFDSKAKAVLQSLYVRAGQIVSLDCVLTNFASVDVWLQDKTIDC